MRRFMGGGGFRRGGLWGFYCSTVRTKHMQMQLQNKTIQNDSNPGSHPRLTL